MINCYILEYHDVFYNVSGTASTRNQMITLELEVIFGYVDIWKGFSNKSFDIEIVDESYISQVSVSGKFTTHPEIIT